MEVLEVGLVGLVASAAFVVELVPLVVGLHEQVWWWVDCSWILKQLGTSAWEAVHSRGVKGEPVGHIT